jgi:hypothetical protein
MHKQFSGLRPEHQFVEKDSDIQDNEEQGNERKALRGINILDRYQTSTPFFDLKPVS